MHMKAARLQTLPLDQVFIVVSYSGKGERFLEANLYIYIFLILPAFGFHLPLPCALSSHLPF